MKTLTEKAFNSLKDRILDFTFLPGVKLSDDEIAAEFKISRTPVREALNRLAEMGLVEAKSNRGFRVKTFSKNEIEDIYILREALECLAVRLTIGRMNSRIEKKMKNSLEIYPSLIHSGDIEKFNIADNNFHDMIASFSGNEALHEYLKKLYYKTQIIRRYDHLRPGSWEETYEEHLKIVNEMVKRNVEAAQKSMSKHILRSMQIVLAMKNSTGKAKMFQSSFK